MVRFRTPERLGTVFCLAAAASFALQPVLVRVAFDDGASVASVGVIRFAVAAAILCLVARGAIAASPLRTLLAPFVLGLTVYGAETGLFFASLERIDVSLASLLMCSYPALVVGGAILLRRERASRRRAVALVVALVGVSLVLAGGIGGAVDAIGITLALGAAVAYAAYVLVSDRLLGSTEPLVLAAMLCIGAATAFALGGTTTRTLESPQLSALLVVFAIGVVATVLPIVAFLAGVRRIGPSRATILGTVEPPVTIALSALVFGERLGAVEFAGAGLVLSAVLILQLRRRPVVRPVPQPAPTPAPTPLPGTERIAA